MPAGVGGPDSIENACPLCPTCHADFGANPERRSALREVRDWWWRQCATSSPNQFAAMLSERLESIESSVASSLSRTVEELKSALISELLTRRRELNLQSSLSDIAEVSRVSLPSKLVMYDAFSRLERAVSLAATRQGVSESVLGIRNRLSELEKRQLVSAELRQRFHALRERRNSITDGHPFSEAQPDAEGFVAEVETMIDEFNRITGPQAT